jgi:hypothetical protein
MSTLSLLGVVCAIVLAIFGYVIILTNRIGDVDKKVEKIIGQREITCEEHGKQLACIPSMKQTLEGLAADNKRSWGVLDKYLASVIHSPIHKERDALMDRFKDGVLTSSEIIALRPMLEKFVEEEKDNGKKLAGALALMRLETMTPIKED